MPVAPVALPPGSFYFSSAMPSASTVPMTSVAGASAVGGSLRRPAVLPGNLLPTALPGGESVVYETERAYAAEQLLRRQNPLRQSVPMPSLLAELGASGLAVPPRYDSSIPTVPGDLFCHRGTHGRAAVVAPRRPLALTLANYIRRTTPATLDAEPVPLLASRQTQ